MTLVERLQGAGATVLWSAELSALVEETRVAMTRFLETSGQSALDVGVGLAEDTRTTFAALQGWTWTGVPFLKLIVPDTDVDCFTMCGNPIAMVLHLDDPSPEAAALPLILPAGFTVDRLPASWRRPGFASAFVLRDDPISLVPTEV